MEKQEKDRMREKIAVDVKTALDQKLKGNWNVFMGKDMQISIGLLPQCRMFRLEDAPERLFCFETHTFIHDSKKKEDDGKEE